jgi:hypothetical protein
VKGIKYSTEASWGRGEKIEREERALYRFKERKKERKKENRVRRREEKK